MGQLLNILKEIQINKHKPVTIDEIMGLILKINKKISSIHPTVRSFLIRNNYSYPDNISEWLKTLDKKTLENFYDELIILDQN